MSVGWLLLFPAVGVSYYIGWHVGWWQGLKASNTDRTPEVVDPAKRPS